MRTLHELSFHSDDGMSYLTAIAKARHEILKDNEEPRDLLVSANLKNALQSEIDTPYYGRIEFGGAVILFGMKVEWTKAGPLTKPQISIRTAKGDMRIVTLL